LGPLDLRVGHQIIVWGRADAFNPTNNLTPIDLGVRSPIEDDRRLGNVGARAFLNFAPVRIEGVWMPLYSPTVYPALELNEFVTLSDPNPRAEITDGTGGGRVHLELPDLELSGSYVYGKAPLPGLTLGGFTAGVDPPEVRILRMPYAHHVAGFDFSTAIGDVLAVRGEAAYRHPVDYEAEPAVARPDVQYVVGVDRAFGAVSVIAQYLGRYVLDWERAEGPENPIDPAALAGFTLPLGAALEQTITDSIEQELGVRNQVLFAQTEELQHLASLRIEWRALHETLRLSALGLVNFTTREWVAYPKLGYQLSDRMVVYVGGEIYAGPDGTLLGLIDEELSAGYTELRVNF
jgi:hypothetical protein